MVNGFNRSIFFPAKSKRLARIVSIKSPAAFKKSISTLTKGGLTTQEKRSLVLARTRAAAQLKRKTLSTKERTEFKAIANMKIPKVTMKRKTGNMRMKRS